MVHRYKLQSVSEQMHLYALLPRGKLTIATRMQTQLPMHLTSGYMRTSEMTLSSMAIEMPSETT